MAIMGGLSGIVQSHRRTNSNKDGAIQKPGDMAELKGQPRLGRSQGRVHRWPMTCIDAR